MFSYVTNTLVFLVYKDHSGKCQGNCMIVPWLLRLPRCQRANGVHLTSLQAACFPSHVSTLSILLCYHPPPRHVSSGLDHEAHVLCLTTHWQASWGTARPSSCRRRGQLQPFVLSHTPTLLNSLGAPTNQTVRDSHTALMTAVCRREKDRLDQSDFAGNHSMLFKVNVFVIYKKFPAWSFV